MSEDVENHTLRLLQEMRAENQAMRVEHNARFDDLTQRIDGNTIVLNLLAGLLHDHEQRLTVLESKSS